MLTMAQKMEYLNEPKRQLNPPVIFQAGVFMRDPFRISHQSNTETFQFFLASKHPLKLSLDVKLAILCQRHVN